MRQTSNGNYFYSKRRYDIIIENRIECPLHSVLEGGMIMPAKLKSAITIVLLCVFAPFAVLCFSARLKDKTTFFQSRSDLPTVVIDAGHGGEDGGAVSVSGAIESKINLAIALRLDQLLGLYGVKSVLLRNEDISLHDPSAKTIKQKKVSDLQNRVSAIEAIEHPVVISIHQNIYTDSKSSGAQVFYANGELSKGFAQSTQELLRRKLDPNNKRVPAPVPATVYLMNHITCKAILVECGFLSNPKEDRLLQTAEYQTKLAFIFSGAYLNDQNTIQKGECPDGNESKNSFLLHRVW